MKTIKDMLSRLALFCRLEVAIVSELEKLNERVASLEANRELKDASILDHTKQLQEHALLFRKLNAPRI